jgi:guanosine-3',5'-bis(diphosphate) 3'-pyrophosphohydrolase
MSATLRGMPATPRIEAAAERSQLVRDALRTAERAHAGQVRNGSGGMAYIEHPRAVAELLAEHGYDEEALAAALLHDVVEDSEMTVGELRDLFGPRVAAMVAALSDDESIESYRDRKDEHRERVVDAGGDALAVYAADKLTNVSTLHRAHAVQGEEVASEFNMPLELKLDVWGEDLAMLRQEAPDLPFLDRLEEELSALRDELGAPIPRPGA